MAASGREAPASEAALIVVASDGLNPSSSATMMQRSRAVLGTLDVLNPGRRPIPPPATDLGSPNSISRACNSDSVTASSASCRRAAETR
jgi:hypothetical protein